jgi:hypothetical protein
LSGFNFDAALRWGRFDSEKALRRRNDDELPFLGDVAFAGPDLLLDTCVYIDLMQDRAPTVVDSLLDVRSTNHSTVAIQELMHTTGVLEPNHPGTKAVLAQVRTAIEGMRPHRILLPDANLLGRAALLSGIVCRIQGFQKDDRYRCLQDCTLFLQAKKYGLVLLTGNIRDFDILLQLLPDVGVLFYRR